VTSAVETYVLLRAFVDELARSGMRAACTSPGSRSAPLALTLARESRLRCYSHVDERCAGFFALGLAKASRLPVAVACTSGTAAAELLPAAIEAHEARVPLLLLTADRPPELRANGAGQAIDQLKLYGDAAKWFFEVGTHEATPERLRWMRTLACRAYATAREGRPGVVHLNFALREPLVSDEALAQDATGRSGDVPYVGRCSGSRSDDPAEQEMRAAISHARRGVIVAGREERGDLDRSAGKAAAAFAAALGWPLLGDPLSGARRGPAAVAHYDALLRHDAFAASVRPDLVLRVGDLPVSKPLRGWLAGLDDVPQVALDPDGAWQDPAAVLSRSFALDPASALGEDGDGIAPADADWLAGWRSADELAAEAILGVLGGETPSEPRVALELGTLLPEHATLFVARARHRDLLADPSRPAARAVQPRRQRHRRHRLERLRRSRRGGRSRRAADRRRRARARHRRAARRPASGAEADDRAARQRRRRHLRLPARGRRGDGARDRPPARLRAGHLHPPHRHADRPGLQRRRQPVRAFARARRGRCAVPLGAGASAGARELQHRRGARRPRGQRATAPPRVAGGLSRPRVLKSLAS
jgi:2-succinyl-5-enolpyruvyl-6-hydroxy-3-cyclohexene-1-carboxylate synthase